MHPIVSLADSIIAVLKSSVIMDVSSWRIDEAVPERYADPLPDECVLQLLYMWSLVSCYSNVRIS